MKSRLQALGIVLLLLPGIYLNFEAGKEEVRLQSDYKLMAHSAGNVQVDDPSKVYIQALETDTPLHFAWRLHTPANFRFVMNSSWANVSGNASEPKDFIVHLRLKTDQNGQIQLFLRAPDNGSGQSWVSQEFADWLEKHQTEFMIQQAGKGKTLVIDPGDSIQLLSVRLPESLVGDPQAQSFENSFLMDLSRIFDLVMNPPTPSKTTTEPKSKK